MTKGVVIGIDLGTTNSLAAVLRDGAPVLLPNGLGELLTPSAVSIDDDGHVLVGAPARARAATHPDRTALAWKRDMGTERTYTLAGRTMRPEELSALVLASLKHDAEAALGAPVSEAVITVPAYFGDLQRQATKDAAAIAGLRVERIINEPTAAALAYGLHQRGEDVRLAVLDLGGGTFDVTVLEIIEGIVEIQGTAGDARLGGEDFVDVLVAHLGVLVDAAHGAKWRQNPSGVARLREAAERAKRELSTSDAARVLVPGLPSGRGVVDVDLEVDRATLDALERPLVERMRAPVLRALRDASVLPGAIERVLLVGGATRMPCVARLAREVFGREPLRDLPPDEAVALGAAVQAALKQGDAAVEDLVVTDVAPFTLGISTGQRTGTRIVEGLFTPILERGTVIPASRVERFSTITDFQNEILVEVFQGEHSLCRDNVRLGSYRVANLPKKPAGQCSIDVRFTYDLNGILEVEMSVVGTSRIEHVVIERNPGQLTSAAVESARRAMSGLKFHPRDALPNRTALARGDAAFAELTGEMRQLVQAALTSFRAALDAQDAARIEASREQLLALLARIR